MPPFDLSEQDCAWTGREMERSTRWVRYLLPNHIDALDTALRAVEAKGIGWQDITAENFPLPSLAGLIEEIREELENGSGLMKLQGVPVERYTTEQLQKLYIGLGRNIGTTVHQNKRGELMRFIQDEGGDVGSRYGRIDGAKMEGGKTFLSSYARTLTNGALRYHTDRTDVVSLLCVRRAAHGGVSTICSSVSVMNEMQHRRPDLADVLFEPIYRSRHGEESDSPDAVYPLPVFAIQDGKFTSHFSLTYIEAAQTFEGSPKLTSLQREAIKLLLDLASELSFEMVLDPGDIQFLNSHVTYHGRTPFEDTPGTDQGRLLMRLWLSMPGNRALPPDHAVLWRNIAANTVRGGIGQALC